MINYAICEIGGKQVKVVPGREIPVDFLKDVKDNLSVKVLLLCEDNKIETGKPYLKGQLDLKVCGAGKGVKIRVSKFHAKANYRRVKGSRAKVTKVVFPVKE